MAQPIRKEIPTWDINWTNTVFTLLNDVEFIDDLWFDGAIYTNFTRNGRVLTLVDAPELSIFVDYQTWITPTQIETECTLWNMLEEYFNLTGQTANSTNFNRNRAVRKINSLSEKMWKGRVTNILNPQQTFRAGKLWFEELNIGYRVLSWGILTEPLNIWDTTVDANTEFLLPAWYARIGADFIRYTGKTDTTLTGISGQTTNHLSSERITQLYELPDNFFKPIKVDMITQDRDTSIATEIPMAEEGRVFRKFYDIHRYDNKWLLEVEGFESNDEIRVNYQREYVKLSADTDLCSFPWDYGIDVVATLVAWEHMYQRGMPDAQTVLNSGYTYLENMYQEFTNERRVIKQSIRPQNYSFASVQRFNPIRR